MLPSGLKGNLKKRLSTVKGQIEAMLKMLDEDQETIQFLSDNFFLMVP